jgi:hypothetical protein
VATVGVGVGYDVSGVGIAVGMLVGVGVGAPVGSEETELSRVSRNEWGWRDGVEQTSHTA